MVRAACLTVILLFTSQSFAQRLPKFDERPDRYNVLVTADAGEQVLPLIREWTDERKATIDKTTEDIARLGTTLKFENLSYDRVLSKFLPGGRQRELGMYLNRPKDISIVALFGDQEQRSAFADEMFFLELMDRWLLGNLNSERAETFPIVDRWARSRAAFAEDFAAKRTTTAAVNKGKYDVVAETLDSRAGARVPVPNYEVMYVLELWEDYPNKHQPFPQFSTPTRHDVGAGLYIFYCRKNLSGDSYAEGPRRRLYITNDTPLDLYIP